MAAPVKGRPQMQAAAPSQRPVIALVVLTFLAAFEAATEWFADTLYYHPDLGWNFQHVYPPWDIISWYALYNAHYSEQIRTSASAGLIVGALGIIAAIILKSVVSNSARGNAQLHGSAKWATKADIIAAGLLPRPVGLITVIRRFFSGRDKRAPVVYVGGWIDPKGKFKYLKHSGPEHVLTYAPTRSGKGVGLIIPTLLSWTGSALVTDLKGELWALTAGWRQRFGGNRVIRFEPARAGICARWNPLEEIRLDTDDETGDVQNLASLIVDPDGKGLEDHWQKTAFALYTGVILHALKKAKLFDQPVPSLADIDAMLAPTESDVTTLWVEMTQYGHDADRDAAGAIIYKTVNLPPKKDPSGAPAPASITVPRGRNHPAIGRAGKDMLDREPKERGSVLSTTKSYLSLYRDPIVANNVSASDFRISDMMRHDDPVTVYVITQPNDKDRLKPLVRVFMNMSIRLLADKLSFKDGRPVASYKHRLLIMADELASLGKLDILQESLAFLAGYGIKVYAIFQDLSQLKSREKGYGDNETITSSCHVQNAFPPNRLETAEHLSKLTGTATVLEKKVTTSGRRHGFMHNQVSITSQETARPLLTPDECLRMKGPIKNERGEITEAGDMIVYVAGFPAIYGRQPLYFDDPVFLARSKIDAPETTDRLRFPGVRTHQAAPSLQTSLAAAITAREAPPVAEEPSNAPA